MTTDSEATIRERAYQIWESEGRPEGRDLDHWLKAAGELGTMPMMASPAIDAGAPAMPKPKAPPKKKVADKVVSLAEAAPAIDARKKASAAKRKELN